MSIFAENIITQHASESEVYIIDFRGRLRKNSDGSFAETLTGSPTVTDATGDLTLSSKAVNTAAWIPQDDLTDEIPIGCGVQFRVTGGTAGEKYPIIATCGTTDSDTKIGGAILQVVGSTP